MNINVNVSDIGIRDAISALLKAKDNLKYGAEQTIEILAKSGSYIANHFNRSMATATDIKIDETTSIIESVGKAAIIAEFGAGDATIPSSAFFPNASPDVASKTFRGSYSMLHARQYIDFGEWEYPPGSNNWMSEVVPRHGMYYAMMFVVNNSTNVAKGVIKL